MGQLLVMAGGAVVFVVLGLVSLTVSTSKRLRKGKSRRRDGR
jgi:uncharacterized membrane protein YqjE